MRQSREAFPPEELQGQDRREQPHISLEAMRNSLLALHPPESEIGQEIDRAYQEATEGQVEYLLELYEKQQEQLDRYAENELAFFGNILSFVSTHWGEYFRQQGSVFQEYQEFIGPLFDGCQGRFSDLVDLDTALLALGSSGKNNIFLKQKVQMIAHKATSFHESPEEKSIQDAQMFLTDLRLRLRETMKDIQDYSGQKKTAQEDTLPDYYDSDDIADDEFEDTTQQRAAATSDTKPTVQTEDVEDDVVATGDEHQDHLHEVSDIMTRVTDDKEQVVLWKKMMHHGFFRGLIREQESGVFVLSLTHQILPWCGLQPEEFFQKNKRYHDLFPVALAEITNPKTGEYFPEAVFLDDSGYALRYFLQDRWDEYLRTPQYRTYYYHFVDQQVPFTA